MVGRFMGVTFEHRLGLTLTLMSTLRVAYLCACLALGTCLTACSPSPPASGSDAAGAGVPLSLVAKLERRHPLSPDELTQVMGVRGLHDPALLALVAQNPGVPVSMLETMARHPTDVVRAGVAANPSTPPAVLERLRGAGPGQLINRALAMNPSTPTALLLEMRSKGEVGDAALAANPSLPEEVMLSIAQKGAETERVALAANSGLPPNIAALLRLDQSEDVKAAIEKHRPKKAR